MQNNKKSEAQNQLEATVRRLNNTILFQSAHLRKITAGPALCEVVYKKGEPAVWLHSSYVEVAISEQIRNLQGQLAAALLELDELVFGKD